MFCYTCGAAEAAEEAPFEEAQDSEEIADIGEDEAELFSSVDEIADRRMPASRVRFTERDSRRRSSATSVDPRFTACKRKEEEKEECKAALVSFAMDAKQNGVGNLLLLCRSYRNIQPIMLRIRDKFRVIVMESPLVGEIVFHVSKIQAVLTHEDVVKYCTRITARLEHSHTHSVGLTFADGDFFILLTEDEDLHGRLLRLLCAMRYLKDIRPQFHHPVETKDRMELGTNTIYTTRLHADFKLWNVKVRIPPESIRKLSQSKLLKQKETRRLESKLKEEAGQEDEGDDTDEDTVGEDVTEQQEGPDDRAIFGPPQTGEAEYAWTSEFLSKSPQLRGACLVNAAGLLPAYEESDESEAESVVDAALRELRKHAVTKRKRRPLVCTPN